MPLKSLIVADTIVKGQEIYSILQFQKIHLITDDNPTVKADFLESNLFDLVVVSIESYERAIFIFEEFARFSPKTKTVFLFDSDRKLPRLFFSMMDGMVDWTIAYENIHNIFGIVAEICHQKYHFVEKVTCEASFSDGEMQLMAMIQANYDNQQMCKKLHISIKSLQNYITNCNIKLSCTGTGKKAIGTESFRVFGELKGLLN